MRPFARVCAEDIAYFETLMPGRALSGEAIGEDYDHDEMTEYGHFAPEAVRRALSTEEVAAVLR